MAINECYKMAAKLRAVIEEKKDEYFGLNIDDILVYFNSELFKTALEEFIKHETFSCKGILRLFEPVMNSVAGNNAPESWLEYCYYFSLNKSFPQAVPITLIPELNPLCSFYLDVLRQFFEYECLKHDKNWQEKNTIKLLDDSEVTDAGALEEYSRFRDAFYSEYVYEMMKLAEEVTGHSTLDHICGVHYLALYIGRQLHEAGIPIDLGRVSGSAAGHDIGKYGCKESEHARVPYLHYYYTDYWFKKHSLNNIGHIAVNHSTWDLELENLPVESLVLIYSDFRVKSIRDKDNKKVMCIFSLAEAFEVIFNKLDNMTEEKKQRYHKVYEKIMDFEKYMLQLGIDTTVTHKGKPGKRKKTARLSYTTMQGSEIVSSFKYYAINHNIRLMHRLKDEHSLSLILEAARNESDWKNLREYIRIFEEYSTYLTQKQKLIMLRFLYSLLEHPEDDIRRHCAELIGLTIAMFDEDYRKEIPKDEFIKEPEISSTQLLKQYLQSFLYPDTKIPALHRGWISYSTGMMVNKLFAGCRARQLEAYRDIVLELYTSKDNINEQAGIYLLDVARYIPIKDKTEHISILIGYINDILTIRSSSIRISALELLRILYLNNTSAGALSIIQDKLAAKDTEGMSSKLERFLFYKLSKSGLVPKIHDDYYMYTDAEISEMFLQNLKTNTHWVVKRLQIEILLNNALNNHITEGFHTAMHFCNLLKVSGTEAVRNSAGAALLKLMPVLTSDQINDIAVELLRALELDGYQYASYIPYYLGQVMLYLSKVELEEFIDDMLEKIKHSNPQLNSLLLRTAGIYIVSFLKKHSSLSDVSTSESVVLKRMILLVLNSLADFNQQIKQAAFALLGKDIFGSKQLTLEQKYGIFALIAKKAITLITDVKEQELQFLSNSSTFNHIYRFINEYKLNIGEIRIEKADKIAIYNGIFDPFTVYHKEIARQIRDMGFEVHLSVDEFAWERRSMPNLIRRSIINMSIADEFNMYLFPEDFPLNTDNSRDVQRLLKAFPGCEVYIVLDSVELLSGCRRLIKKNIDGLCYILLDRKSPHIFTDEDNKLNKLLHGVGDKVLKLQLLEIGKLHEEESVQQESAEKVNALTDVDPLARRFIKEFGMYKAEPLLKSQIKSISLESEVLEKYDSEAVRAILSSFGISRASFERLERLAARPGSKLLLLQSIKRGNVVLGFSVFHKLNSGEVYDEFGSIEAANYIYDNASGNIVLIDGIFIRENTGYHKLDQMVLTETLSYCLANEYEYCIYCDKTEAGVSASFMELLGNFGFMRINAEGCDKVIFAVDMSSPCTLYMDIRNVLKEPYRSSDIMQKVIGDTRKSLMKALVELYPGKLVLSFDRGMLYDNLVKKICGVNQVSTQAGDGKLGSKLCVPYGNILHKYIVPNTITKSLHTEKYFEPGLRQYSIGAFPYYLDLETQFKMVSSFNKPIILVDDLLNKGYRLKALEPMLSNQKIRVEKVIVGILSNRGKDLANIMGLEVDCAYYIPKLKAWFNESDMYPFIGGDAVWRGIYPKRNLLPSVNLILPYAYPTFLTGTTKEAVYNLSITALENSYRILCALEDEYQRYNERMLTLALLGDVLTIPRCPDHGEDMEYNISLNPSHYLKNDIEVLKRIEPYGK